MEVLAVLVALLPCFGFLAFALYLENKRAKAYKAREDAQRAMYERILQILEQDYIAE